MKPASENQFFELDAGDVAVVVPAYREERLLRRTLGGVPDFVEHIVVVDDGSPDETYDVACACATDDPRVDVVRLGFNRGVGGAIVAGYRRALSLGADVAVVMAGDAQMDPDDLPAVLAPVLTGRADYVKGNRLVHPEARRMPAARRFGSRLLARVTAFVAGIDDLDDSQCGYTAISREMLERLPLGRLYPRYGYPNDLLIRLSEAGARIVEVPVRPIYADEVSGFSIPSVIGPIGGILVSALIRTRLPGS